MERGVWGERLNKVFHFKYRKHNNRSLQKKLKKSAILKVYLALKDNFLRNLI
jgi:hypothetical protein